MTDHLPVDLDSDIDYCTIDDCSGPHYARGWCSAHYQRWWRHGSAATVLRRSNGTRHATFERLFMLDVQECIVWPHIPDGNGYGVFQLDGVRHRVHRLALQRISGSDGDGLFAIHGPCHNRLCLNARNGHVTWGTSERNVHDRLRDGTDNRGEAHGMGKLTEADVRWIRNQVIVRKMYQREVADLFKLTQSTVSQICNWSSWSWLDPHLKPTTDNRRRNNV